MKRIIAMFLSCIDHVQPLCFPAYAIGQDAEQNAYETVVTISGEENIRRYLASVGEEYDPTLLCIQRRVRNTPISPDSPNNRNLSPNTFIREYVIRNKRTTTYTDTGTLLKEYRRPAGRVLIDEGINISTTYTADAGISAEFLEASLGFEVEGTSTFRIEWEATYSYAVKIRVYPVYEKTTGEVWDDDVWYDDYIGNFTVYRAVGDDVRVYRA